MLYAYLWLTNKAPCWFTSVCQELEPRVQRAISGHSEEP